MAKGNDTSLDLRYEDWATTKRTFHMVTQMVGKVRLALVPARPEWLHACLYLDARGLTTGPMPYGLTVVTIRIDMFDSAIVLDIDGRRATVMLGPDRAVADIWHDFRSALAELSIDVDLWDKPQETIETTPFSANTRDNTFDAVLARRFHRVLCTVDGAFETFRSPFFGRSGVQFWWGGCDFSIALFTGRHLEAPEDRGRIVRYDLDAEHLTAGFWPGDDNSPGARMLAYIVPRTRRLRECLDRAFIRRLGRNAGRVGAPLGERRRGRGPACDRPRLPGQRVSRRGGARWLGCGSTQLSCTDKDA